MKIATWNVNSLRARADRVEAFLERHDIDVLAIQETKCRDENFPWELFERAGYEVVHNGNSQWNGVAIASRVGLSDVQRGFPGQPHFGKGGVDPQEESRAIGATVGAEAADGVAPVRLWSLYVPNGRGLENEHMGYKLEWLRVLQEHAAARLAEDPDTRLALAGDWNIAPQDEDVWDIELFQREGYTHVSPAERAAFHAFEDAGLVDVVRPRHPGPACTRTGTTRAWPSPRRRACASTSSCAPPPSHGRSRTPGSTARSARARAPRTTRPWSSSWAEPRTSPR